LTGVLRSGVEMGMALGETKVGEAFVFGSAFRFAGSARMYTMMDARSSSDIDRKNS